MKKTLVLVLIAMSLLTFACDEGDKIIDGVIQPVEPDFEIKPLYKNGEVITYLDPAKIWNSSKAIVESLEIPAYAEYATTYNEENCDKDNKARSKNLRYLASSKEILEAIEVYAFTVYPDQFKLHKEIYYLDAFAPTTYWILLIIPKCGKYKSGNNWTLE